MNVNSFYSYLSLAKILTLEAVFGVQGEIYSTLNLESGTDLEMLQKQIYLDYVQMVWKGKS